jgi:general secretion pathway protein D
MTSHCISPRRARAAALSAVALLLAVCLLGPALSQPVPARRAEPVTLNFNNADIEAVARTLATLTGRNVVVDPRVKGTLSLNTDKPVSPQVAFNQFTAQLRLQGFAVVQSDGLYKVVPEAEAKLQTATVSAGAVAGANNQIVTQIFRLNHENANSLVPVLRPLISPNNSLNVNSATNSLVITDYADNLRRLARIIAALDVANASDVEVIPLRHALASELAPLVARLLDASGPAGTAQGGGQSAESYRTTLMAEPRGNALIVRAANPARVALVRTLVDKLDRPAEAGLDDGLGHLHVVHLKNADATQMAQTLRGVLAAEPMLAASAGMGAGAVTPAVLQPGSTGARPAATGGQIQADAATNSLIITAPGPQFRQLRAVIERLDGRRAQVWVESLIAEVNTDKAAEFGIQWQGPMGRAGDGLIGLLGTNFGAGGNNILNLATQGLAGTTPNGVSPGTGLNLGLAQRSNGVYVLGFLARALEQSGSGNILSTPNLLTLDNEEARIVIGQNVPFVTGRYTNTGAVANGVVNPFQTIERRDVGLTLRVRPQISESGSVKMAISQEVSSVQPSSVNSPSGPITNKRSIDSNVMVEDGAIVVLGGLLQDDYADNEERVPVLGDLPLIGNLFKNRSRSRKKTNLMVFLRPVVVRDATATDDLSLDRYELMRVQQRQSVGQPHPLLPVPGPEGLPTWPRPPSPRPAQTQPVGPQSPASPPSPQPQTAPAGVGAGAGLPGTDSLPPMHPGSPLQPRGSPAPVLPPSDSDSESVSPAM